MSKILAVFILSVALWGCSTIPTFKADQVIGVMNTPRGGALVLQEHKAADKILVYQSAVDGMGRIHLKYIGFYDKSLHFHPVQ